MARLSTSQYFELSSRSLSQQQSDLFRLQQQMGAGTRILAPSDDPGAASSIISTQQVEARAVQFQRNIDSATYRLGTAESVLGQIGNGIQNARELLVSAGNASLSISDRASIATALRENLNSLIGLANSKDGNGRYLFSGYQDSVAPYAQTATGATYTGDTGQPQVQVGAQRYMAVANTGADIFEGVLTGNGTFATTISDPDASGGAVVNTGTGLIDGGSVLDASGYGDETYVIKFNAAGTTYDVIQRTSGVETTLSSANAYTSGTSISLGGGALSVSISGAPAEGDRFVVAPSTTQNIFTTLQSAITALNNSGTGALANTTYNDAMRQALGQVDQATDVLLTARTSMGARLNELESLKNFNDSSKIQATQRIGALQDVDYAQAVSDLARNQLTMQAAQQAFTRISKMTLFDYL